MARKNATIRPCRTACLPTLKINNRKKEELTTQKVFREAGVASFREIVKGQIADDCMRLLKLPFHCDARKLLRVYVMGDAATEIIHIGRLSCRSAERSIICMKPSLKTVCLCSIEKWLRLTSDIRSAWACNLNRKSNLSRKLTFSSRLTNWWLKPTR